MTSASQIPDVADRSDLPPLASEHAVRSWGLPLLAKDLLELAMKPRTYQVRGAYAVSLLLICCGTLYGATPARSSPFQIYGIGARILIVLGAVQTLSLWLVLPILASGSLTVEKERKTLDLLLLTKLGPTTIILEKFFSRLIPALNFILISLPILAFSYSLGGITIKILAAVFVSLLLLACRLTSVAVMCSAGFRTTTQALISTYLTTIACFLVEQVALHATFAAISRLTDKELVPDGYFWIGWRYYSSDGAGVLAWGVGIGMSLLVSLSFLLVARRLLVASGRSGSAGCLDDWLAGPAVRERSAAIIDWRERHDTPAFDPISWREGPRIEKLEDWWAEKILGRGLPWMLVLAMAGSTIGPRDGAIRVHLCSLLLWSLVTLWICIKTSGLIVSERTQQTLDVLLTTPLSGAEIIWQKMAHVRRIMILARLGLGACAVIQMLVKPSLGYFLSAVATIWMYPPLIAWQAMACAIAAKNRASALLNSLLIIAARCLVPLLIVLMLTVLSRGGSTELLFVVACVSPLTLLVVAISLGEEPLQNFAILAPLLTVAVNGMLLIYLKIKATSRADEFLGRVTPEMLDAHDVAGN